MAGNEAEGTVLDASATKGTESLVISVHSYLLLHALLDVLRRSDHLVLFLLS